MEKVTSTRSTRAKKVAPSSATPSTSEGPSVNTGSAVNGASAASTLLGAAYTPADLPAS